MKPHHEKALEKFMNAEGEGLTELQEAVGVLISEEAMAQAKLQIIVGIIHSADFEEIMSLAEQMPAMITGTMQ